MGFGASVKICLRKYFDFSGRAKRSEFWWFLLFSLGLLFLAEMVDFSVFPNGWPTPEDRSAFAQVWQKFYQADFSPFVSITDMVLFFPLLGVTVRRLHDINRSGRWVLPSYAGYFEPFHWILGDARVHATPYFFEGMMWVTYVGSAMVLVMAMFPGKMRSNRFGACPEFGPQATVFD